MTRPLVTQVARRRRAFIPLYHAIVKSGRLRRDDGGKTLKKEASRRTTNPRQRVVASRRRRRIELNRSLSRDRRRAQRVRARRARKRRDERRRRRRGRRRDWNRRRLRRGTRRRRRRFAIERRNSVAPVEEPAQRSRTNGMLKFANRFRFDLTHSFARYAEYLPHFFKRIDGSVGESVA